MLFKRAQLTTFMFKVFSVSQCLRGEKLRLDGTIGSRDTKRIFETRFKISFRGDGIRAFTPESW
jgi:hypothetical protein